MAKGILNGKKTIKAVLLNKDMTQRDAATALKMEEPVFNMRLARGYYDKPANLAKIMDDLGLVLKIEIKAGIYNQNGELVVNVPVNNDFMNEE